MRPRSRAAWAAGLSGPGLILIAVLLRLSNDLPIDLLRSLTLLVGVPAIGIIGAFIASRRPGNPVAWLMIAVAVVQGANLSLYEYAVVGATRDLPGALPALHLSAVVGLAIDPAIVLAIALFPSAPFRSVRPLAYAAIAVASLQAVLLVTRPGPLVAEGTVIAADNPIAIGTTNLMPTLGPVLNVATTALLLGATVVLVRRYLRAATDVKHQIRWVVAAVSVLALAIAMNTYLFEVSTPGSAASYVASVAEAIASVLVAAAAGIAILRYRLYDIDVVISKALVFTGLATLIASVYVGVVVGVGHVVGRGDDPDLVLSVLATAVVAVLFQPVRQRLRRWANRLVYGQRATPYEVLQHFSHSTAAHGHEALRELAELLGQATGTGVRFEVRTVDGFETVADTSVANGDGDAHEALVTHGDEVLGRVTVLPQRGEELTDSNRELVAGIAAGLAVVFRNRQLTSELRATVRERAASRRRLVRSGDEARQMIERSLRVGPEQALASLASDIRSVAADAAARAPKTAQVLRQLGDDAHSAIETIRELASGAYPALLSAEGVAEALTVKTSTAPFPVVIDAPDTMRLDPSVESAVYFSVLEALQNAAKYADPETVQIRIDPERNGHLEFEVRDDGVGFDPDDITYGTGLTNMRDRLDTVDGTLEVRSRPGSGTVVRGRIPKPISAHPAPVRREYVTQSPP
ncbi:MAG: ATP-binding protein [Nitriliruptorales bacterium]|nr:ATP-binding protein [Nitriliruptorales bacterium]